MINNNRELQVALTTASPKPFNWRLTQKLGTVSHSHSAKRTKDGKKTEAAPILDKASSAVLNNNKMNEEAGYVNPHGVKVSIGGTVRYYKLGKMEMLCVEKLNMTDRHIIDLFLWSVIHAKSYTDLVSKEISGEVVAKVVETVFMELSGISPAERNTLTHWAFNGKVPSEMPFVEKNKKRPRSASEAWQAFADEIALRKTPPPAAAAPLSVFRTAQDNKVGAVLAQIDSRQNVA